MRRLDPNRADSPAPLDLRRGTFGPELTWKQRAALDDVQTTVEYSEDLRTWSREGVATDESAPSTGLQSFTSRVTGDAGQAPSLHLRIRWTLVP